MGVCQLQRKYQVHHVSDAAPNLIRRGRIKVALLKSESRVTFQAEIEERLTGEGRHGG